MDVTDTQSYLGIQFTWKGRVTPKQTREVERMLQEITSAQLRPYQRMELVREFMVPKLLHELILGCAHRNTISRIDKMIRKATRAWLRLPKDTSLGFLHAPINSGGLGVPCLGTSIPLLQRRFEKFLTSESPFDKMLTELHSFKITLRRINLPCRVGRETVCSSSEVKAEWERMWSTSADGRSGVSDNVDPASYTWLSRPTESFRDFICEESSFEEAH